MIPLAVPNLAGREAEYLQECIDSTYVSTIGPFVDRFEEMVANAAGTKYAIATSSGTTALHAGLTALGVRHHDLVIAPAFTFIASIASIAHCGASAWFMDVSVDTWTLDPVSLERSLTEQTHRNKEGELIHTASMRRVSAILPVFTLGIPADMDRITQLAELYQLPVISDAAAALGSTYKGQASGALKADFTMYSFNGNKTVTAGGGGAIATNDEAKAKLFRHLTTTARVGGDYDHDMVGFNYRMTNLQAAVGCAQMENLDTFIQAKRKISATYELGFADIFGLTPFPAPDYAEAAHWFSGAFLAPPIAEKLPQIRFTLNELGIGARPFWKPAHMQAPYRNAPAGDLSVTESIWERVLTLPCSTGLSSSDQAKVIHHVRETIKNLC